MVYAPLDTCKERDPKGLYARAERGEINDIAGWHMPFEAPESPEVYIDTTSLSPEESASLVLDRVKELGYV
jgi:adenylylsulfate kinase-like enzyme